MLQFPPVTRFFYGGQPLGIVVISNIVNCALIFYFYQKYDGPPWLVLFLLILTYVCYLLNKDAQGISTLWAFMYGFQATRSLLDNLIYGIPCLGLIMLPLPELTAVIHQYSTFTLWPWSHDFQQIAVFAHAMFAALGFGARHYLEGQM